MKKYNLIITVIFILLAAVSEGAVMSVSSHLGYSPAVGGSMSSGGQADPANGLGVTDGINDINRSGGGFDVATVESPVGLIAGADLRIIRNSFYWKAGIEYVYQISGGKGKTIDITGAETVDVLYKQWSFDAPFTMGITLLFWDESRIYAGGGVAFAYGKYSNSFKSAALVDFNAGFTGYAIPLVAEIGCEHMLSDNVSLGGDIRYLYGKSMVIEDGADYARIDFSGFHITATASYNINI